MQEIGLTTAAAQVALNKYGLNELPSKSTSSVLRLLLVQTKNVMSLLLFLAMTLSFIAGDKIDGFLILAILILNILLGFWQEYKASKELEVLKKLEVATARVMRDGAQVEILANQLVPGDLIILESGDKVPADATLIESADLMVNEASLTGESLPVEKSEKIYTANTLFFGTSVTHGRCTAKVFATGTSTKFGSIALTLVAVAEEQTPLEIVLDNLGKKIGILAIVVAALLFGLRIFQGSVILDAFFGSIALMVAAVPEGLPAIITIALAFGVRRMYLKKTLVRRMSAVESLGGVNIICTDKTGTLTLNEMRVKKVVSYKQQEKLLTAAAVLCNSASLVLKEEQNGQYDVLGDSTEGALLLWAKGLGVDIEGARSSAKLVSEIPFDLKRRMMTTVWESLGKTTAYSKGAPEVILPLCKLSKAEIEKHTKAYQALASEGLRVLAFAMSGSDKQDLDFLGFVGIADEARPNVKEAITKAQNAGIRVVMITGDNELTAKAIGEDIGLLKAGDEVLTGSQLDSLDDSELLAKLDKIAIFARVVPEHKLRIVRVYQARGDVVAVTGDGVNDSLALKQAQVGVAMGKTGTDVAKEASDLIILDDNFVTIIAGVEEGRLIYHNILKAVKFLLTGNLSEVLVIVVAVFLGLPTPFVPVQILWINFVTDGLPALSLVVDPSFKGIMARKPQNHSETLLSAQTLRYIITGAVLITLVVLSVFYFAVSRIDLQTARSFAFSAMVVLQMIMVLSISTREGAIFPNKYLTLTVAVVLAVQALIMFYPPLQLAFKVN